MVEVRGVKSLLGSAPAVFWESSAFTSKTFVPDSRCFFLLYLKSSSVTDSEFGHTLTKRAGINPQQLRGAVGSAFFGISASVKTRGSPRFMIRARSTTFSNALTLPGQS